MGYAWNGKCYADASGAVLQFSKDIPQADAAGVISLTSAPVVNQSGLISWSISHRPLTGTTATTRTGTTQLQTCSDVSMETYPVQSLLFYVALVFAFLVGFRTGYRA